MYYLFYNLLLGVLTLTVLPFLWCYSWLTGKNWPALRDRVRLDPRVTDSLSAPVRIWLHAASVGEVQVARALIGELQKTLPAAKIILSTVTEQGQRVARQQLGDEVLCIYAPLDLPLTIDRFLTALRPTIYVCLETELWPNIIRQTYRKNIPLLLLNGRISARSFNNYLKIKGFTKEILNCFAAIATIKKGDAERYMALGADPAKVVVLGNAKYDLRWQLLPPTPPPGQQMEKESDHPAPDCIARDWEGARLAMIHRYRVLLQVAADQPILIAGSTHSGEEEQIIEAYKELKETIGDLLLVIAPRHLNRVAAIASRLGAAKMRFVPFSQLSGQPRTEEVILLDVMGELAGLYALATYVFCGGSLVDRGGHNIMEAAIWGKPVFYGPHMKDFADAKELLEAEQAGFPVRHVAEMVATILALHADPDRYQAVSRKILLVALGQQGSAAKQARLILDRLP